MTGMMRCILYINEIFECLWFKIVTSNTQFYVSAIYHPPDPVYEESDLLYSLSENVRKFNPLIQMQKLLFLVTLMV